MNMEKMDRTALLTTVTLVGTLVTILSFLVYIFVPDMVFVATFVAGVVMMVGGYTILGIRHRQINRELTIKKEARQMVLDGCILSLDGPYIPEDDTATIESLENLRCPL